MAIVYYDIKEQIDISRVLKCKTSSAPDWFTKTTHYIHNVKTKAEFVSKYWDILLNPEIDKVKTIRSCPGFTNYFKQNVPIIFPTQVMLETSEDGGYRWRSGHKYLSITHHNASQAPNIGEKYIILKFCFPIWLKSSEDMQISFIDPIFYNEQPYKVCPGIMNLNKNEIMDLNVITLFPKKNNKYIFEEKQVLSTVQFSKPNPTFVHKSISSVELDSMEKLRKII